MRLANTVTVALFLVVGGNAIADEEIWQRLKQGANVVLIRHAVTTPGAGDPPGMRLEDCSTQRNLTDEGRAHARRIGEELMKRAIPLERVLSSPWCQNQGFALGPHLGLHCHIEMTEALVRDWCDTGQRELARGGSPAVQNAEKMARDLDAQLDALHAVADVVYAKWVEGLRS